MKWKIKPAKLGKPKWMFLFLPRYCGRCGAAYWFEWARKKRGYYGLVVCECDPEGNEFLTLFKPSARRKLRDKQLYLTLHKIRVKTLCPRA